MVEELNKRNINDIVFMGDFFHNRSTISVNTLSIASKFLDKFKDKHLYFILGNHDLYYSNNFEISSVNLFNSYPNITIFYKPSIIEVSNKKLLFCGWGYNPLDELEGDILFIHSPINIFSFNRFEGPCNDGLKASDLTKRFKTVFSGHFHTRQEKVFNNGSIIRYTGNPFQMDYSDEDTLKGFDVYDIENNLIEFVENKQSPFFKRLKLSELIKIKNIKRLKSIINNSFFKLIIDKNITLSDLNILIGLINTLEPINVLSEWENGQNFSQNIDEQINGFDLKSAINEYISLLDVDDKEDIKDYIMNLYDKCSEI